MLVENNLVYHQGQGGVHFNWYCLGNIVQRNVFYWNEGALYTESEWPNFRMVQDYNLYWDVRGGAFRFLTFSFGEWQEKGLDQHSVIADPLFVDPEREDFALRPESPAFRLGFRPIDLSPVGPRQ